MLDKELKLSRLWLTDGSCIRLRPLYRHHVWAYDYVADRTHDTRPLKMLTVLDPYSRECQAIVVARRLRADDVLQTLSALFVDHGPPAKSYGPTDGPEFTAKVVREWLEAGSQVKPSVIPEPGSPFGECLQRAAFNGTLGEEVSEAGDPLHPLGGGESAHRTVAAGVQHHPTLTASLRYRPSGTRSATEPIPSP